MVLYVKESTVDLRSVPVFGLFVANFIKQLKSVELECTKLVNNLVPQNGTRSSGPEFISDPLQHMSVLSARSRITC